MATITAAAGIGVAALVWRAVARVGPRRARRVLGTAEPGGWVDGSGVASAWVVAFVRRRRGPLVVLAAGCVAGIVAATPVPTLLALPGAWIVRRRRVRAAAERDVRALRCEVVGLCTALAGELRAGRSPEDALALAADAVDEAGGRLVAEAVACGRVGGDVADALDRAAARPGAEGLRRIAACWRIATDRGGGFAPALERIAATLRAEEDGRAEVLAELAGARSTAHVLAGLPVLGVFLGSGLGARPGEVLLRTPVGIGCLCAGAALVVLGLEWTDRLVAGAVPVTA